MSASIPSMQAARVLHIKLSAQAKADTSTALRECLAQVPEGASWEPGTLVAIAGEAATGADGGILRRIASVGPRTQVHRALRCTALVARGYVRIGAAQDAQGADWVWGYVP